jgi:DNA-binding ferritin-like protein (Dps family)
VELNKEKFSCETVKQEFKELETKRDFYRFETEIRVLSQDFRELVEDILTEIEVNHS